MGWRASMSSGALAIPLGLAGCSIGQPGVHAIAAEPCAVLQPSPSAAKFSVGDRIAWARGQHADLRRRLNAPFPSAETTVLVMLVSAHHSTTQLSYVATRGPTGSWAVSRVGRTTSEFVGVEPDNDPEMVTVLPDQTGKELDRLVADPCLYGQPFAVANGYIGPVGGWQTNLVVVTPGRRYAGQEFGPIPGVGGRIVSAITGW